MDYKLELVLIPVTDVDRAKNFYTDKVGFKLDVDHRAGDNFRVVQMTQPAGPVVHACRRDALPAGAETADDAVHRQQAPPPAPGSERARQQAQRRTETE